jgi:hypothetical protein
VRACGQIERLLLVVDQFEELFTLVSADTCRAFAESLVQLYDGDEGDERDNVCVLLTLRADFYGQAIGLSRTLSDRLGRAVVNVGAMTHDELAQAVRQPAANTGVHFQPGLVDTILADVGDEPGALPLLEFALLQLWQRRHAAELTLEAYRDIGGAAGALARHAQATYTGLSADEQAIARRVLLRLVVPGDGANHTRQRASTADLVNRVDPTQVEHVVQVLINARLLTASRDALSGARFVEISHEALIRGWHTFADWIDAERDWLREHRRLAEAVADWRQQTDEALLYRGARLADVLRLRAAHADELSSDEEDFLAHSRRLEARRERSRYLGQAAGGAVGTGFGYGAAFALGFATSNPGPNGLVLTGATFAFLFVVGQLSGFAIGIALWLWRAHTFARILAATVFGGCVGMLGYLAFLRFLLNAEPTLVRASVGALVAGCLAVGVSVSQRRTRRFQGAVLGGVIGTTAAVSIGGIAWSSPVMLASGLTLGVLSGAGFYLTSTDL